MSFQIAHISQKQRTHCNLQINQLLSNCYIYKKIIFKLIHFHKKINYFQIDAFTKKIKSFLNHNIFTKKSITCKLIHLQNTNTHLQAKKMESPNHFQIDTFTKKIHF